MAECGLRAMKCTFEGCNANLSDFVVTASRKARFFSSWPLKGLPNRGSRAAFNTARDSGTASH